MRPKDKPTEPAQCREKIQSYLTEAYECVPSRSEFLLRAHVEQESGYFSYRPSTGVGGSKLLTLVMMKSPGEDWLLTRDGEKIFVTLPLINQVAVVNTRTWKIMEHRDG